MLILNRCIILAISAMCLLQSDRALADIQLTVPQSVQLVADGTSTTVVSLRLTEANTGVSGKTIAAVIKPSRDAEVVGYIAPTDSNGESTITLRAGVIPDKATITISSGDEPPVFAARTVEIVLTLTNGQQPSPSGPVITDIYPKSVAILVPMRFWDLEEPVPPALVPGFRIMGSNLPATNENIDVRIGNAMATVFEANNSNIYVVVDRREEIARLQPGPQPIKVTIRGGPYPVPIKIVTPILKSDALTVTVTSLAVDPRLTALFLVIAFLPSTIVLYTVARIARLALNQYPDVTAALGNRAERRARGDWIPLWLGELILDPQTSTYSLARAQFVWWVSLIVNGWMFLFMAKWTINGAPSLINISGFYYTLLISLTTLVAAKATTTIGARTASVSAHPTPLDLVGIGGDAVLERVFHVVWNVIIGVAFICITVVKYTQTDTLPTIPREFLGLMGIGSVGYIGGKVKRSLPELLGFMGIHSSSQVGGDTAHLPGPTIVQVLWKPCDNNGGPYLVVYGDHLSNGNYMVKDHSVMYNSVVTDKGVTVQFNPIVNGKQNVRVADTNKAAITLSVEKVATVAFDPITPNRFARVLQVDFCGSGIQLSSPSDLGNGSLLTIMNADGQKVIYSGPVGPQ